MNLRNMTIGQKISFSFGAILFLLIIAGLFSFFGVGSIVKNASTVIEGNRLDGILAQKEVDHLNWVAKVNALLTDDSITTLDVQTDDHKCGFGVWLYGEGRKEAETLVPSLATSLKAIEEPHRKLHQSAVAIGDVFKQSDSSLPAKLAKLETAHLSWAGNVRDALLNNSGELDVQTDPTQCGLGKWLSSSDAKKTYQQASPAFKQIWDKIPPVHNGLHVSAIEINKFLKAGENRKALDYFRKETDTYLEQTLTLLKELNAIAEKDLEGMRTANRIYASSTLPALNNVQELLHKIRDEAKAGMMSDEIMLNSAHKTKLAVSLLSILTLAFGLVLAFLTSKGVLSLLRTVSTDMKTCSDQVACASNEISSTSQSLAEGASDQASSLEETSASLEEILSVTQGNTKNAELADQLMKNNSKTMKDAEQSMNELTASMEEIKNASSETQKIVKTIDEIAFQTNLLALNAAVEAARAGEAGAGFAVVADEVRNLAMRAAEAARNTSGLIEGTVDKVNTGAELLNKTSSAFFKVAEDSMRIGSMISEISTASQDQAKGIEHINSSVSRIDTVTQNNAAAAEESAAASEELSAQAEVMRATVNNLLHLVGGAGEPKKAPSQSKKGKDKSTGKKMVQATDAEAKRTKQMAASAKTAQKTAPKTSQKQLPQLPAKPSTAEDIIPFDDEEFEDF